ncbi:MAG TPA: glycosyltransferase family 25 protein [Devosia sp.]|jgi:GR25 family glycosyltransferase involved in LPS biosynthesis|uniref:glycosyltransferase family 25 protein n=1 Tax=Devosia sp. TaxID=1871048 RepID=UPI002DDD758B|nr:glycosyltransferase family 25 protein [Devosia sp.]HEV2518560.1 glycosyltransferase family 25 protein [Devosia sp.]
MSPFPADQIPVYYINLASRPDRRKFMEQQFERLGIVAERIDAVTIADVGAANADPPKPLAMTPVEIACTMSHEKTWCRMLDAGQQFALLLEDDAVIGDGLKAFLEPALCDGLQPDLVKLETFYDRVRLGRAVRHVSDRFGVHQLLASHFGTAAYIISATMARRVLADPRLRRMSIDRYLFTRDGPVIPHRGLYQANPAPVVQLQFYRGDKSSAAAQSDLKRDRDRRDAKQRPPLIHRYSDTLRRIAYTLRLTAHILPDAVARRQKRREVPFERDV